MLGHVKVTRQDGLASKGEWERKRVRRVKEREQGRNGHEKRTEKDGAGKDEVSNLHRQ